MLHARGAHSCCAASSSPSIWSACDSACPAGEGLREGSDGSSSAGSACACILGSSQEGDCGCTTCAPSHSFWYAVPYPAALSSPPPTCTLLGLSASLSAAVGLSA